MRAAGGWVVIDDAYNSSPSALAKALQTLATMPGRHVAVLGEMLELGDAAVSSHERCGRAAAGVVDLLIAIGGPAADSLVSGARAEGLPADRIHRFADSTAAADIVPSLVQPGDVVLVKGSRGTRTDLVADRLGEAG